MLREGGRGGVGWVLFGSLEASWGLVKAFGCSLAELEAFWCRAA